MEKLRKRGYVKEYKDVYPDIFDRIHMKKGIAYMRGNIPLKLMAVLYDIVIVYVPPLSKKQLEQRYSVTWAEFIRLCQHNMVIPIIGNVLDYIDIHFNDLFTLSYPPYSLWARGIGLLEIFGMKDALSVAEDIFPVDRIAEDAKIFKQWKKRTRLAADEMVKQRIKMDIAIQYADLCIFG